MACAPVPPSSRPRRHPLIRSDATEVLELTLPTSLISSTVGPSSVTIRHRQRRFRASRLSPRHHDRQHHLYLPSVITSHLSPPLTLHSPRHSPMHYPLHSPFSTPRSTLSPPLPAPHSHSPLPAPRSHSPRTHARTTLPAGGPGQPTALPVHGRAVQLDSIKTVLKARLVSEISA
jgi:hypothetical protein